MRRFLVLVLLAALARSDDQGRQFPPGVIVDPQYYDQPNYDEGPLERPPHFGGRPPHGDRPPYYGDNPYGGQPPYEQNNDQKQGYQPKPYRPTAPPVHRPGPPPQGYGPYPPPGYNEPGYRPGPPSQGYGPYPPAGYNEPGFGGGFNPMGSFSNALESLAKYDEKQCVARMLCELSAGGRPGSGYYRGSGGYFDFSGLQGVVDLLGAMTASQAGSSPMLTFGRAALLGATMRDPYRCYRSFPNCPRDPDRLVDYLNNHNGGFFRLFEPTPTAPPSSSYTKRPYYYNRKGKKLDEAEHKEQRESEQGESSNLVNPRIINDAPPLIADRTGTGDLRLDREQLEPGVPSGKVLRGARNLGFFQSSNSQDGSHDKGRSLTFPKA